MKQCFRISAVIPVFNNARSTIRAVHSILRQTSPAHEIILVDDASHPDCVRTISRFIEGCRAQVPIHLLQLPQNGGPGLARHEGARHARGEYVAFLDADDLWHRNKLESIQRAIEDTGAELLGHDRPWKFRIARRDLIDLSAPVGHRTLGKMAFLKRNPIPTSSIVATRPIASEMFRYGGRKSEDYMALVVASRRARRTVYLDAPLCWALKPPFGVSGEGADQVAIYSASAGHMIRLWRDQIISATDLLVFSAFLAVRVPVGLLRLRSYQRRYGQADPAKPEAIN